MRRLVVLALLAATACARYSWQGNQELSRSMPAPADSLVYAAARALRAHGYEPRIVNGQLLVTLPHAVPQYTRPVSTNPEMDGDSWVIQVQAVPNTLHAGSTLKVAAFIVPRAAATPADSSVKRQAIPVTDKRPELLRELERVGNWIVDATHPAH